MKTPVQEGHLERSNTLDEFGFSIVNNSHIFNIISGGLYKNPLFAVVRETICNAIDAQIEAGRQAHPINIWLPSKLHPDFALRDTGNGINHENMRDIYCVIGESTKRGSTETTGALGLGCKSPLSYRDQFAVSCFDGETVRRYSIGWDEKREPKCILVAKAPCIEPPGLEFRLAIREKDMANVRSYVAQVLSNVGHPQSFEVAMPFVDGEQFKQSPSWGDGKLVTPYAAIVKDGDESPAMFRNTWSSDTKTYIYMGNVRYPATLSDMMEMSSDDLRTTYKSLSLSTPVLFAPLAGDDGYPVVFPTAGRDSLQRSDKATEWLKQQLTAYDENFIKVVASEVDTTLGRLGVTAEFNRVLLQYTTKSALNVPELADELVKYLPKYDPPLLLYHHDTVSDVLGDELRREVSLRSTDPDDTAPVSLRELMNGQTVLLVDEPYCWRIRYECGDVYSNVAITATEHPAATMQAVAHQLKRHEIPYTFISTLEPIKKEVTKTPRSKEKKVPVFLQPRYGNKSPTDRWDDLRYTGEHGDCVVVHVVGYTHVIDDKTYEEIDPNHRDTITHECSPVEGLLGIRRTQWPSKTLPEGKMWYADFLREEINFMRPWIERMIFAEAWKKAQCDNDVEDVTRFSAKDLTPVRPEIAKAFALLRDVSSWTHEPWANYARELRTVSTYVRKDVPAGEYYWRRLFNPAMDHYMAAAQLIGQNIKKQFPLFPHLHLPNVHNKPEMQHYLEIEMKTNPVDHFVPGLFPKMPPRTFRPNLEKFR